MQIRKTYQGISPQLLYDGIRDLALKHGLAPGEARLKSYSIPDNSSEFIYDGVLIFNQAAEKALGVLLVGSDNCETRVMFDINDGLFPAAKVAAFTDDLDFLFGCYEVKAGA